MVAPRILVDAARPRGNADHLHFARRLWLKCPVPCKRSRTKPLLVAISTISSKSAMMRAIEPRASAICSAREIPRHSARHQGTAQEPVPDQTRIQAQQIFAQAQRVRVGDRKTRVRANGAYVGDMIVEPFELEQDDPQVSRARWNGHAGERFNGLTKSQRVRHARIAGNSLGQFEPLGECGRLEKLFNPFVDEIHARFEIDDRFAFDAEAKMAGLDDARVHGPTVIS